MLFLKITANCSRYHQYSKLVAHYNPQPFTKSRTMIWRFSENRWIRWVKDTQAFRKKKRSSVRSKISNRMFRVRGLYNELVMKWGVGGDRRPDDITPSCSAVRPPTLAQSCALDLDCVAAARVCAQHLRLNTRYTRSYIYLRACRREAVITE